MDKTTIVFLFIMAGRIAIADSTNCKLLETFNVGLTPSVPESEARKPRIIEAILNSPSDTICLQEIWQEEDLELVIKELSPVFPHHYSAIHKSKDVLREPYKPRYFPFKDKPCGTLETAILSGSVSFCAWWYGCLSKSGWDLGECLVKNCRSILSSRYLSESCVSCVFMNGLNSLTEAGKICSIPGKYHNRLNNPGLLIMSKQDLGNVQYSSFYPGKRMNLHRGYIRSEPDANTNIVCTHLSSNVAGYIEYGVNYGSYKAQQTHEIKVLNSTFKDVNTVVSGDLNTGPRVTSASDPEKNLDGEFPDNYDLMVNDYDFASQYVTEDGHCTYCSDNPLAGDYPNQILDHIMVKPNSISTSGAERAYDSEHISDHYGVRLQVCT